MANNQLLASDNFASGSLASGWVLAPNASGFTSQITASAPYYAESYAVGTFGGQIWTGLTWGNDQVSEVTVANFTSTDTNPQTNFQLYVRVNAAGTAGYEALVACGPGPQVLASILNYGTGAVLAGAASVTVSALDVWTLQAAGCCITLYQNGSPVLFIADATFPTGGSPGFGQNSHTALTHSQIASWRGYSCIQQDGIWQKQGVVLAPNATDLASAGQGFFGGTFIYDSNPQLILGTNVYKVWFSGGTPASQGTYYAESPDLINWTRNAAQVISGYTGAMVIKVGSTYYSYSQLQNQAGSGNIALHTSSDGVTWTRQSTNVLAPGAGGAWDSNGFYPLRPITVIGGTWYALTTGAGTVAGKFEIGLATSTDGAGAVWTKYAGNPVLAPSNTAVFPLNTAWTLVNGTYYFWHAVGPSSPQQGSGQDIYQLPSETARYSTSDFINWSGPVHSIHHSDQYESVNNPIGATPNNPGSGLNPCGMFTVGNQSYAIGQAEYLDGASAGTQFSLAIAPAPLSQVVLFNEDGAQQTQTDAFTSGTGNLDPNWTTLSGLTALKIVAGNLCEPTVNTGALCAAAFTGATFGPNQYAEITVSALTTSSSKMSPLVYANAATGSHYRVIIVGAAGTQGYSAQLIRDVSGTLVALGPVVGITPNLGDVLRLAVVQNAVVEGGSAPVISFYQNGSLILQYVDQSTSALTSGNPGIIQSESASAGSQVSLFASGNTNVPPWSLVRPCQPIAPELYNLWYTQLGDIVGDPNYSDCYRFNACYLLLMQNVRADTLTSNQYSGNPFYQNGGNLDALIQMWIKNRPGFAQYVGRASIWVPGYPSPPIQL